MKSKEAVIIQTVMASEHKILFLIIALSGSIWICQGQSGEITDALKNVFLRKALNASESELILKSARESFLFLKNVGNQTKADEKSNFAKNYANFLSKLFEQLKTKDVDVREVFSKENAFLKDYRLNSTAENVNVTELQVAVEDFQIAAERLLIPYYNSSSDLYDAAEILNLENSRFDAFLREKLRTDYSEIGYFFLEVFATLIGLSWGVISTVIYVTENMTVGE